MLAGRLDQRLLRQGDWPALAQLMQTVHDQGHDVAAITRSLVTATPLSDLPPRICVTDSSPTSGPAAACLGTRSTRPQPRSRRVRHRTEKL